MELELISYLNKHVRIESSKRYLILTPKKKAQFPLAAASYNQGFTGTLELCNAMSDHINAYFAPVAQITAEHITWAAGVTALNEMLTMVLCDEKDSILIGSTIYGSFNKDMTSRTA